MQWPGLFVCSRRRCLNLSPCSTAAAGPPWSSLLRVWAQGLGAQDGWCLVLMRVSTDNDQVLGLLAVLMLACRARGGLQPHWPSSAGQLIICL